MRTRLLILTLLLALAVPAVPVHAQNTSTTMMALVSSPQFTNRLQYLGAQVAKEVLEEAASASANGVIPAYTAACHTRRVALARAFLIGPAGYASISAVLIVGVNVSGAVIVGTATGSGATADSSASDGSIQQAYRVIWNALSGCATNE